MKNGGRGQERCVALPLDHKVNGRPVFHPKEDAYGIVFKKSDVEGNYGKYAEGKFQPHPCTRNGNTASRNGAIGPEYGFSARTDIPNNAELVIIYADGEWWDTGYRWSSIEERWRPDFEPGPYTP